MADNVSYPMRDAPWGINRISWAAIFSGVMVALGTAILFTLFGTFIGFRIAPAPVWDVIWYLVTSFCALFAGGWVAGRVSDSVVRSTRSMHGLVTWGLATVAALIMVTWSGLGLANSAAAFVAAFSSGPAGPQVGISAVHASNVSLAGFFGVICGILGSLAGSFMAGPREAAAEVERTRTAGRT